MLSILDTVTNIVKYLVSCFLCEIRIDKNKNPFCNLFVTYIHRIHPAYSPFRRFVTTFINSDSVIGGIFAILTLC